MGKAQVSVYDGPVVIVGAGVAGLVTAHLLAEAGAEVVVIEKLPIVGGLARSFHYDEFVFDCGPHRFYTANPNVSNYLDRVLARHGTCFPRKSEVFFKGKYYGWPIKPQNLVQLPPRLAAKSFVDLTVNGFKEYGDLTFEDYILRQYGPTLYEHFFRGYSEKFLGIHPRETHSDWAKVGINRAIIDDKAQMQNLFHLLKTTLLEGNAEPPRFLYPVGECRRLGCRCLSSSRVSAAGSLPAWAPGSKAATVASTRCGQETSVSSPRWSSGPPVTLACEQLGLTRPKLDYLGLLLYNVMVNEEPRRDYQWCYYGSKKLLINRVSVPRFFSPDTAPQGTGGYCCEVTCMKGDSRWEHAERLTDWVIDDLVKVNMIRNRANVIDARVERLEDSYPIYQKDYPGQLDLARQQLSQFENFQLAGRTGLFWYNNMDHSMENAMQLTKRLLRDSGRADAEEAAIAAGLPMGA